MTFYFFLLLSFSISAERDLNLALAVRQARGIVAPAQNMKNRFFD